MIPETRITRKSYTVYKDGKKATLVVKISNRDSYSDVDPQTQRGSWVPSYHSVDADSINGTLLPPSFRTEIHPDRVIVVYNDHTDEYQRVNPNMSAVKAEKEFNRYASLSQAEQTQEYLESIGVYEE